MPGPGAGRCTGVMPIRSPALRLVQRCAPGCALLCTTAGLAAAHAAHAGEITAFCCRSLRDRQQAEDVTQEVFLRAWRRCDRFVATDPQAPSVRAWLYAIARNAVIDAVRARRRRPVLHHDPDVAAARPAPRDAFADSDTAASLQCGLGRLGAGHRSVLEAVYLQDRTHQQAATLLGIPPGTVKSRVHYGLQALREELAG